MFQMGKMYLLRSPDEFCWVSFLVCLFLGWWVRMGGVLSLLAVGKPMFNRFGVSTIDPCVKSWKPVDCLNNVLLKGNQRGQGSSC